MTLPTSVDPDFRMHLRGGGANRPRRAASALAAAALLAATVGCGQKGDLMLPPPARASNATNTPPVASRPGVPTPAAPAAVSASAPR
jgi:predicted small lipoprotein YifL